MFRRPFSVLWKRSIPWKKSIPWKNKEEAVPAVCAILYIRGSGRFPRDRGARGWTGMLRTAGDGAEGLHI